MNHKAICGGLVFAAMLSPALSFAAPAVPAPADSVKDERPARDAKIANETPAPGGAPDEVRFTLTEIRVGHDAMKLSDERLAEICAGYTGHEINGASLGELLKELTNYARSHGYPTAAAYIPEQTATDGRLLLRVLPGRLGKITLENENRLSDDVAKGILARLKEKEILRTKDLESALYLLDDLSGVHAAATLSAGADVGGTDLSVKISDDKPVSAILYAENYGSEAAGRYRSSPRRWKTWAGMAGG